MIKPFLAVGTLEPQYLVEIIAIAREESAETVIAWRDENGIKVPLATDPDRSIYNMFAAVGIPRFITVSTDNKVIKMTLAEGENQLSLIDWHGKVIK